MLWLYALIMTKTQEPIPRRVKAPEFYRLLNVTSSDWLNCLLHNEYGTVFTRQKHETTDHGAEKIAQQPQVRQGQGGERKPLPGKFIGGYEGAEAVNNEGVQLRRIITSARAGPFEGVS